MTNSTLLPAWLETLATSWDGCMHDAPGEMIDIGASIRSAAAQATAQAAPAPSDEAIMAWAMEQQTDAINALRASGFVRVARAVLARWAAGVPAAAPDARDGLYYLQDARWASMVGNCPSFWRPNGNGYTSNLDEAARFTFAEAMAQHRCRKTDLPWLCSEVDKLRRATIDCQYMPRSWDEQRAAIAAQAGKGVQ